MRAGWALPVGAEGALPGGGLGGHYLWGQALPVGAG